MSTDETKIEDAQGKYFLAVKNGQELSDAEWEECRLVLTDRRLVIVADGTMSIPLGEVDRLGGRYDVNQRAVAEGTYTAVHVDGDVVLVTTPHHGAFETSIYRAILDGAVVYVKHPAKVGGVVQEVGWQRGRVAITDEEVRAALEDGGTFAIDRDDIGEFESEERTVAGERRSVLEVEHTEDDRSVETHLSGMEHHISVLEQLLEEGAERNRTDLDLGPVEQRVVMALYSGVSPFAVAEFVGVDVEEVEAIYDDLLELDVLEVVRERSDVSLTARGRKVAGEAMSER